MKYSDKKSHHFISGKHFSKKGFYIFLLVSGLFFCIAGFIYDSARIGSGDIVSNAVSRLHLDLWDWMALIVALASLFYTIRNWMAQEQTKENTTRLNAEDFRYMLLNCYYNIIRNTINLYSLSVKLQDRYSIEYPSEEYLLKLKLYLLDEQVITFHNISKVYYYRLQRLSELCRFFNLHIDITQRHLSSDSIPEEIKIRDIENLKSMHWLIASQIMSTMDFIFPAGANNAENRSMIRKYITKVTADFDGKISDDVTDPTASSGSRHNDQMSCIDKNNIEFLKTLFPENDNEYHQLVDRLHYLIKLHCGNKKDGYSRIPLIPFNK